MNIEDISRHYKILDKDRIVLSYQGPILQSMIEKISSVMNNNITGNSALKISNRFQSLFVEQAQNILHYSSDSFIDETGAHISNGFILTGYKNDSIFIISGNPINKDHEIILKEKLDKLANCSKSDLNKLFKEQLKSNNNNVLSRGASLGLIDMKRKSDHMEYHFNSTESGETFFSLKTEYSL